MSTNLYHTCIQCSFVSPILYILCEIRIMALPGGEIFLWYPTSSSFHTIPVTGSEWRTNRRRDKWIWHSEVALCIVKFKKTRNTFCRTRSLSNAIFFSFLITWRSSSWKSAAMYKISSKSDDFCCAMLCISVAYAVMQCLCVCVCVRVSVTFVSCVETKTYHQNFFIIG